MDATAVVEAAEWRPWTRYSPARRWLFLGILFLVSTSSYIDRNIVSILIEPIKAQFGATDTMMGLLSGFAFAAIYGGCAIPVAWLADRADRRLILTIALLLWSLMTVLCGLAQNFGQLLAARAGVGMAESGANAPAQSLIADYFPPEQRSRALSIFASAAMIGYVGSFILAAHLAESYGWRTAFIALGLPGTILPFLCRFLLKEPRTTEKRTRRTRQTGESLGLSARRLAAKRSYVLLVLGMSVYFFVSFGAVTWFPSYMVRVLHADLVKVAGIYGGLSAVSALVGTIGGGFLADRLAKRDVRWLAWLPAMAFFASWPIYMGALFVSSTSVFIVLAAIGAIALEGVLPLLYAVIHRVCGSPRRATAVAGSLFVANLIGLGLGPPITGMISDWLRPSEGTDGLRSALMLVTSLLPLAGLLLWASARYVARESEV